MTVGNFGVTNPIAKKSVTKLQNAQNVNITGYTFMIVVMNYLIKKIKPPTRAVFILYFNC